MFVLITENFWQNFWHYNRPSLIAVAENFRFRVLWCQTHQIRNRRVLGTDRNAICWCFASIRLCLALLFIITIQNLSNCNESSQFYEYFGSKFLAGFSNFEPLCGVVAATLSTLSSRLLAFKGCCACDTLVGLQAFRLNEEACHQQFLLLFSAFLVYNKWHKLAKD